MGTLSKLQQKGPYMAWGYRGCNMWHGVFEVQYVAWGVSGGNMWHGGYREAIFGIYNHTLNLMRDMYFGLFFFLPLQLNSKNLYFFLIYPQTTYQRPHMSQIMILAFFCTK